MTDPQSQYPAPEQSAQPNTAPTKSPSGFSGWFHDPATLAASGLLLAVGCAVLAGFLNVMVSAGAPDLHDRLMALTETVDVGDIALLGIAVALLVITPDPPGGIDRPVLLRFGVLLGVIITIFGAIRSVTLVLEPGSRLFRVSGFIATFGVAVAAATIAFYAAREAKRLHAEDVAAAAAPAA